MNVFGNGACFIGLDSCFLISLWFLVFAGAGGDFAGFLCFADSSLRERFVSSKLLPGLKSGCC